MPRTSAVRQRDADEIPRTHSPTLCEGPLSQSKKRGRSTERDRSTARTQLPYFVHQVQMPRPGMMERASAAWWFRVKRKAEEIEIDDTIAVSVTSAEDGTEHELQVRLKDDVFEQLETQLGRSLLSVHIGDHHKVEKGNTFDDEDIDNDCNLKVVYEPTEKEELRAFMVDVLHSHLDNNVPKHIAEDTADDLVEHFPSFESIFDPTNGIYYSAKSFDLFDRTLCGSGINEPDRDTFSTMLKEEAIRRGLDPKIPSYAEMRARAREQHAKRRGRT